jgi:hypothetical protein
VQPPALPPEYTSYIIGAMAVIKTALESDPLGPVDEAKSFVERALHLLQHWDRRSGDPRPALLADAENYLGYFRPTAPEARDRLNAVLDILARAR